MNTLAAENVVLCRGGRTILNRVSVTIEPGSFLSIAGPNGSGKSSLLRTLAGIWQPSEGSVTLGAKPIASLSRRHVARLLSFVPQDTRMDFAFTAEEIVSMGRHPHRGRFERASSADRSAIDAALARCDIRHLRHRFVNTLSGGERQRVAIARSLAAEPQIILLDEPTSSLDIQHTVDILELCRALAEAGKSVVLATHDLNVVARYTSQVALVDAGRIAYSGDRNGVLTSSALERIFQVRTELLQSASGHAVFVFHKQQ